MPLTHPVCRACNIGVLPILTVEETIQALRRSPEQAERSAMIYLQELDDRTIAHIESVVRRDRRHV